METQKRWMSLDGFLENKMQVKALSTSELVVLAKATHLICWEDDNGGHHLQSGEYSECQRLAQSLNEELEERTAAAVPS